MRLVSAFLRGLGKRAAQIVGLMLLMALIVLRWSDPLIVSNIRNQGFDLYQRTSPRPYAPQPVMIADIDEASLARYGQWPWPRTRIAELVDKLTANGAIVIGFDMVFAEPDRLSPVRIAQDNPGLPEAARSALALLPSNETIFSAAIARSRVVAGETAARLGTGDTKDIPEAPMSMIGEDPRPFITSYASMVQNLKAISDAAAGRGVFTVEPDADGVFRRIPLVVQVADQLRLALSIEVLRAATGGQASLIRTDAAGVSSVTVGGVKIPTDPNGKLWPWFNASNPARYVSAGDILAGTARPDAVAGKMVFIGTSAVGLEDYRATPIEASMPGVEIHVQMIENILTGQFLTRPNYALGMELVVLLAFGLFIVWLVPRLGAFYALVAAIVILGGFAAASWFAFSSYRLLIDATYPLAAGFGLFATMATGNYMREELQKRQIRGAFGQYLSPALVEKLSDNPALLKLGGETRELTVLFTDVRGFTGISEAYKSNPQGLTRLMNRFLTVMSQPILGNSGTIDKYMGDAIMAFWNAPLAESAHALRACQAALAMIANVEALNQARREELKDNTEEPFREIKVGIGVNTGLCVVGNMGSDMRFDYTALGDTVNLASRLEGQSKPFGLAIIMGDNTAQAVKDELAIFEIDLIKVKGKAEPERIHALMGGADLRANDDFQALRAMNAAMISAYRLQDWESSMTANEEMALIAERMGIDLSEYLFVYETRIAEYRANPPGRDWDAVYVATEK
jgi:adenylate cyclase